jgi:thioredoxin-related protein
MKGGFGGATILLALIAVAPGGAADAPVAWREWDEGIRAAEELDRPILVEVCTRWSGPCKRMERSLYSRNEVREYVNRTFIAIRLDAEGASPVRYGSRRFTHRSLAAHFRVAGYPTLLFLRPDGEHLISVPGPVEADHFLPLLRYVGEGHLERGLSWDEFRARRRR